MPEAIRLTPEQLAAFVPDATATPATPPPIKLTPEQLAAFKPDPAPDPRFVDTEEPPTGAAARQYPTNYNADVAAIGEMKRGLEAGTGVPALRTEQARLEAEDQALKASLTPSRTEEEDLGAIDALGRSATNVFGLGPTLSAVQRKAISLIPGTEAVDYDQAKQEARDALERSQAQHPIASLVGLAPRAVIETELGGAAAGAAARAAPQVAAKAAALPAGAQQALAGAGYGAASAAGEAITRDKPIDEALIDTARGAALGGVVGRVVGSATNRLVNNAPERADNWIVKEVIGDEGKAGSTPTTRKQLTRDAQDVKDVVKLNPDLQRAVADSLGGKPEQIEHAAEVNQKHLDRVFAPREKLHAEADKVSETTLGDVLKPIDDHIAQLAKRTGTKNVRRALEAVKEDFKETYGGGAKRVIDPDAELIPGYRAKDAYDHLAQQAAREADPAAKAQIEGDMQALLQAHGKVQTWDPRAPIKSVQLRDSLNTAAKTVENTMGALNEKVSYQKARDLAKPIYDAYDAHIAKVAKRDPELADAITEMERQGSAHLRIKKVFDERALKAEEKQLAGSQFDVRKFAHHPGAVGASVALAEGKPERAVALYATTGIPRAVRATDRALAALVKRAEQGVATKADEALALKAGVSPELVRRIMTGAARATARGITHVLPRAAATVPGSEERRSAVGAGAAALPSAALGALFGEGE